MRQLFYILFLFASLKVSAQSAFVKILTTGTKSSLRGLSVVNDQIIWASGSGGKVAKSTNGGTTWQWFTVPGFEKREFRDIEAFDSLNAVIIAIAEPAQILRTNDGGKNWKTVFEDTAKGMFLDALDFSDSKKGIVVGDPINGKMFIARTNDGGQTWQPEAINKRPAVSEGEACFAASGTNIHLVDDGNYFVAKNDYYLVTGGKRSRLFYNQKGFDLPIMQGTENKGANGLYVTNNNIYIAGGDFSRPEVSDSTIFILNKKQPFASLKNIQLPYCSAILELNANTILACGIKGIFSYNLRTNTNEKLNEQAFNSIKKAKKGTAIFAVGNGGKIARIEEIKMFVGSN